MYVGQVYEGVRKHHSEKYELIYKLMASQTLV